MYTLLWIFILYAFLGWCSEVIFAAVKTGQFVNRGFLLGPVCPIYGLGVSFVLLALKPLGDHLSILFVGSVIITSALEYLVGWLSEKLLQERLWDYSDMPFNIHGYICLAFSLMWGVACVLVDRVIHPLILALIHWIPHTLGVVLLSIFLTTFAADFVLTVAAAVKLPKQYRAAEELERMIRSLSDGIGERLYQGVSRMDIPEKKQEFEQHKEAFEQRKEEFEQKKEVFEQRKEARREELEARLEEKLANYRATFGKNRTYHRLVKAFPHLAQSSHQKRLETIRAYLEQRKKQA